MRIQLASKHCTALHACSTVPTKVRLFTLLLDETWIFNAVNSYNHGNVGRIILIYQKVIPEPNCISALKISQACQKQKNQCQTAENWVIRRTEQNN